MELSIIILNYKSRGLLKNCVRSILMCRPKVEHEIIVVDNDSQDGSSEMIKANFPQVKLIDSAVNVGFQAGNNLGIKQAKGKYILMLNPDIVVLDDAIDQLVKLMDQHKDVAAAACKLVNPDGSVQMNCRRFPSALEPIYSRTLIGHLKFAKRNIDQYLMTDFDHATAQPVDWLLAACLIIRKEAIEKTGMMDEGFFLYFGDVDWCRQFKNNGWQVYYFPEPRIVHYYHRQSAEDPGLLSLFNKKTRLHIFDWFHYLKKYGLGSTDTNPAKLPAPSTQYGK